MGEKLRGYASASGRGFPMVGRDEESALMLEALTRPPAVVLVEGEAGMGKSRLVFETGQRLAERGIRVLTGYCHRLREPLAFGPVLDALRDIGDLLPEPSRLSAQAGALAPLLPDLAGRLPAPPRSPADPRAARFQLVGAVRSVLDALGPVVLVVEDVHWADEATRDLLLLVARDLPWQAGLVLTYRREDLPDRNAVLGTPYRRPVGTGGVEVRLEPLTRIAVDEWAGAVLGPRATAPVGRVLFERSGGLPLVVEEDLITLSAPAATNAAELLTRAEVPRALREAVTARLRGLSAAAVALVQAAAVLAVPVGRPLLAAVAGLEADQATKALTEALNAAVLEERTSARYGFRHVLAQQTIYREVPGPLREDLHQRALDALAAQTPKPLVQIAHHTRAVGDVEAWLDHAEAAADQAVALGDEGTAATLLRDILDQPSLDIARRTRAALALARIAEHSADFAASMATLRRILSDPQLTLEVRGEVRAALGSLMTKLAKDKKGLRELERSVRELENARPESAARAMVMLATESETYAEAHQWIQRAERAVRESPDQAARVTVQASRLILMAGNGDRAAWELASELPRHAEDPVVLQQSARALVAIGVAALEVGHDERAAELFEEGMDLARHVGYRAMEPFARSGLLALDWLGGRWTELDQRVDALAAEFPEMVGVAHVAAQLHGNLAAARGNWSVSLRHLRQVADMLEQFAGHGLPDVLRAAAEIARVHLALDEPDAAYAAISQPIERLRRSDAWPRIDDVLNVAVHAALATGHESSARTLLEEARQGLANADSPGATADLHVAHGILELHEGDREQAAESFDRARVMFEAIGRPYQTAHAIEHTAAAHQAEHPLLATEELTRATEIYTRLGATADASRCHRTERRLGLTRPNPRGRRGYGTELSPRETEVARLLADSATNQDIAHALALSPRTVEHHVANVLKKLATTRAKLQESAHHDPRHE